MKKLKLIMSVALMSAAVLPMQAQFVNAGGNNNNDTEKVETDNRKHPHHYNRFSFGYNAEMLLGVNSSIFHYSTSGYDNGTVISEFAFQYLHGFGLSPKIPIYLELGGRLNIGASISAENEYTTSLLAMELAVPLNVAYRFGFDNGFSLTPYTGFNLKTNLVGVYSETGGSYEKSLWLFDKEKVKSDYVWSHVQFGWQVGLSFAFKKFYWGLEYGYDFNKLYNYTYTSHLMVAIGVTY